MKKKLTIAGNTIALLTGLSLWSCAPNGSGVDSASDKNMSVPDWKLAPPATRSHDSLEPILSPKEDLWQSTHPTRPGATLVDPFEIQP